MLRVTVRFALASLVVVAAFAGLFATAPSANELARRARSAPQAAQAAPAPDFSAIDAVALQELKDANTPGAAIALVRDDRVVYLKGYGSAGVDTGAPVTPDMLFRLGSTTKMFTAAAVVSLAEEGKLKLDEPVDRLVPGLDPSIGRLTAHQLLSHSAGLRDDAVMNGPHDDPALAAGVLAMTRDMFFAEPGRVFSYSNPGFWIAGRLAEMADGRPYGDLMVARLFKPLGMARTTLRPTMAMTWPLAQGHDLAGGKPVVIRPAADNVANWPAGSIFSSAEEMARFVIAFVNEGRLDGRQALSPSLIRTLSTPRVDQPGAAQPKYGYGLTIVTRRGIRVVEHGGSRAGYGSSITMVPDHKVGIIVLANRTGVSLPRTVAKAAELLLPQGPAEPARKPRPPLAMSRDEMDRYAGWYSQVGDDTGTSVVVKDGALVLRNGTQETPIVKVGANQFEVQRAGGGPPQDVWFVLGADGRAEFLYRGTRALARLK